MASSKVISFPLNLSATVDLRKRGTVCIGDALAYIRQTAPANVDADNLASLVEYAIAYCGSRKMALADNATREARGEAPARIYATAFPAAAPVVDAFKAAVAPLLGTAPVAPKAPTVRKAGAPKAPKAPAPVDPQAAIRAEIARLTAENARLSGKAPKADPTGLRPVVTDIPGVARTPEAPKAPKAPSKAQQAARDAFAARARAKAAERKTPASVDVDLTDLDAPAAPSALASGLAKLSKAERDAVKAILGF